jgi:hypothetical protein
MENVERTFSSVPIGDAQKALIDALTVKFIDLAKEVILNVPDSAHRSAALRAILEAKWACTDAIAKGGEV